MIEELNADRVDANRMKHYAYLTKVFEAHMLASSLLANNSENDNVSNNRDLQGYNVIRDGAEIGFTSNTSYAVFFMIVALGS